MGGPGVGGKLGRDPRLFAGQDSKGGILLDWMSSGNMRELCGKVREDAEIVRKLQKKMVKCGKLRTTLFPLPPCLQPNFRVPGDDFKLYTASSMSTEVGTNFHGVSSGQIGEEKKRNPLTIGGQLPGGLVN